jgi:hypothetical protein
MMRKRLFIELLIWEPVMKFNSKTLQASFEQAKPILEYFKHQDAVSEDIHELELFLTNLHLKESFIFNLQFAHTATHEEELLIWAPRRQRLLYVKNRYNVTCLSHDKGYYQHINYNDKETLMEIPLLEAAAEIKKQIAEKDKLALFLSLFAQKIHNSKADFFYFN